jgi:hypothetical protein
MGGLIYCPQRINNGNTVYEYSGNINQEVIMMKKLKYYLPGLVLILLAFLIMAVPEILVAFIAALFVIAGIGSLVAGHMLRKSEFKLRDSRGWFFDRNNHQVWPYSTARGISTRDLDTGRTPRQSNEP